MPKHLDPFIPYAYGKPPRLEIWCRQSFREEVGALHHRANLEDRASITNINALVLRLASGLHLSTESFRQEGTGYAFRAGRVRFYGAYSSAHPGCFVLSHPILKKQQKLAPADAVRTARCLLDFDTLMPRRTP